MQAARGPFDEFIAATGLLTRLPVGATVAEPGVLAAAGWAFPLVGAGVGGLCALAYLAVALTDLGATAAGWITVAVGILATGALHEDGLADTADGLGGGRDREHKLAIMRDSRHGTYGTLALVLSAGLRAAALAALGDPLHAGLALIAAHAASRGALPLLMWRLPPARPDGLGATAGRPTGAIAVAAPTIGAVLALACLGPARGAAALALAGAGVVLAAMLARRQIGGYTGDVLGFFQQIGEVAMLLVAAAR